MLSCKHKRNRHLMVLMSAGWSRRMQEEPGVETGTDDEPEPGPKAVSHLSMEALTEVGVHCVASLLAQLF